MRKIVATAGLLCVLAAGCGAEPRAGSGSEGGTRVYKSERFAVAMTIPAGWPDPDPDRGAVPPGFFLLNALAAESLERGCEESAHHKLGTFGSAPTVERLTVAGREACLILPSPDQHADQRGQAQLIARYPSPVGIGGERYPFLVVDANADHIRAVSASIRFLPA